MIAHPTDSWLGTGDQAYALNGGFSSEPPAREFDLHRLWKTLVRRRRLFAIVAGAIFILVALLTLIVPRTYTTTVNLIAGSANADRSRVEDANAGGTELPLLNALLAAKGTQTPETYVDMLMQPAIAEEVAQHLGLSTEPRTLLTDMTARPVPDTAIITLSAAWRDRDTSAKIANEWAAVFVKHEQQLVAQQADAALNSTRQQLPAAEAKLKAAQIELGAYEQEMGIADLPTQTSAIIQNESTLEAHAQAAELEGRQAAASLEAVEQELAQTPQTIVGQEAVTANPVEQNAQVDVARLRSQLAAARLQYTDNHPTVIALRAQLAEAERASQAAPKAVFGGEQTIPNPLYQQLQTQVSQLTAQIESAKEQTATITRQIAGMKPTIDALPAKARRIAELQSNAKSAQDFLEGLQHKNQDALIAKSTAISDVTVTQPADPAVAVVKPNALLNLGLGLVFAIVLGVATVFGTEFFDDRFRTADDVHDRLGLPILAAIPQFDVESVKKNEWIRPLSIESFYHLVTSLRYSSADSPRTIAFTSPEQGDGKSTIVYNTAVSMSMMKTRVLVIDADLRRPSIHRQFGLSNERGLSDVLVGLASFDDVVKVTAHEDVSVLTSGRIAPNPMALLQDPAFDRLLREAAGRYDTILVDTPALRSIVDSVVLGIKSDGVVMVVSSLRSSGRAVTAALQKLRSVGAIKLLGIVLNGTTPEQSEFSQYYLGAGQSISLASAAE